ncbi:YbaN family protein [Endozoicomonadaceae bacterium StTr2]
MKDYIAPTSHTARILYLTLGVLSLLTGIAGIILPLVPTTPLVLLAAFCFARSSERLHNWILNHRHFGPLVHDWAEYRGIKPSVRRKAYVITVICFSISIAVAPIIWVRYMLGTMCCGLLFYMSRLPAAPEQPPAETSKQSSRIEQLD